MNLSARAELWRRLKENSLVVGDLPPNLYSAGSWHSGFMQGFGGWFASLFLLSFISSIFSFIHDNHVLELAAGIICCLVAFGFLKFKSDSDFITQFALLLSFSGQSLVCMALFYLLKNDSSLFLFISIFELLLAIIIPNFIHRVFTSWMGMLTLGVFFTGIGLRGLGPGVAAAFMAVLWLTEYLWVTEHKKYQAIAYGFTFAFLLIDAIGQVGDFGGWLKPDKTSWMNIYSLQISWGLVLSILLLTVRELLLREKISSINKFGIIIWLATIALGTFAFYAPGIVGALLVVLLGFAVGNRILLWLGLLAVGVFLFNYYYQLQVTLLFKSALLAGSGGLLLLIRLALRKWLFLNKEEEQDQCAK